MTILGHVADASRELDRSTVDMLPSSEYAQQLTFSISFDSCHTEDLTFVHGHTHAAKDRLNAAAHDGSVDETGYGIAACEIPACSDCRRHYGRCESGVRGVTEHCQCDRLVIE